MLIKIFFTFLYYSFYLLFPFLAILIWKLYSVKKTSIEIIILIIIVFILIWARFIEPNFLINKNYNLTVNNNKKLKIVVFSDLHLGVFNNSLLIKKAVKKINKINPDIVIIPGDFVYLIDKNDLYNNLSELKNINALKIATLGNHDYGKKSNNLSRDLNSTLESLGILMIDNEIKRININNSIVEFIGLGDFWVGSPDLSILKNDDFNDRIDFRFLITHNPDSIYSVLEFEKSNKNTKKIDLMLSGHTHGGQIRIPFLYKHLVPSEYNFDRGFYNISGINLFITAGIGNVVLPMRLFNFPEISIINIEY